VIDLGFGNPDLPSPDVAVAKLAESAKNPRNHRYSLSRGLPRLREEVAKYYERTWGVHLDPELEVTNTIGSKEGFSHLMWVLLERGDAAIVPTPSYPIHMYGPLFAGADLRQLPMRGLSHPDERANFSEEFFDNLHRAYDIGWPKPRVLVISFPHNPTGACVDLAFMQRVVDFCREREMIVVHDFAYADIGFEGVRPPSILQAEGAKEVAVEQYSMTKSFSMAGWRSAFMVGSAEVVQALVKLKSYLDYGMFQPVQIAATVAFREAADYPKEICSIYESRCHALIDGLSKIGWEVPKPGGSMFVWAPIPEAYSDLDSVEFCSMLVKDCDVALSPGVGFGPGGEGYARFALIENEQRIAQAMRNLRRGLTKLGGE
ncbi:MAG: aminotransferase class I/II-fold pyridoxal phosphate-dependent enzyme, partial [Actinomycetota bacterium]|nr:aminotransferase class I/II-fold pyridoxal phosphate-dependent enzyme [Actinomycetota bacterium]